jgi:hypothetical protein
MQATNDRGITGANLFQDCVESVAAFPNRAEWVVDSGRPVHAGDQSSARSVPGIKTVTMNAEGELDHSRHAIAYAEAWSVAECFWLTARRFHHRIQMRLPDDAELGRPHWFGVSLQCRQ